MYVSSNEPIPQNSAMAPPPWKGRLSDARRTRDFLASRKGRERAYSNLATPDSMVGIGLGLVVDANQIIQASEAARQAILIGVGTASDPTSVFTAAVDDLQAIIANAPVNLSMNGSGVMAPAGGSVSPAISVQSGAVYSAVMVPTMPAAAPAPVGGVYLNTAQPQGPVRVPNRRDLYGPPNGPPCAAGLSGYPAPWADAYVQVPGSPAPSYGGALGWIQNNPLLAAGIAAAALALGAMGRKRGRR